MTLADARRSVAQVTLAFITLYCVKPLFFEPEGHRQNKSGPSNDLCEALWEIATQIDEETDEP